MAIQLAVWWHARRPDLANDEYTLTLDSDLAWWLVRLLDENIASFERRQKRINPTDLEIRDRFDAIQKAIRQAWLERDLFLRKVDTPTQQTSG